MKDKDGSEIHGSAIDQKTRADMAGGEFSLRINNSQFSIQQWVRFLPFIWHCMRSIENENNSLAIKGRADMAGGEFSLRTNNSQFSIQWQNPVWRK